MCDDKDELLNKMEEMFLDKNLLKKFEIENKKYIEQKNEQNNDFMEYMNKNDFSELKKILNILPSKYLTQKYSKIMNYPKK